MSRAVQITCDVCSKQKQFTNHWFTLSQFPGRLEIIWGGLGIESTGEVVIDLCGEACVLKKVSELIGSKKC